MADEELIVVGTILRAHGLRGEVIVRPASDGSDVLLDVESIVIEQDGRRDRRQVETSRWQGKAIALKLEGVSDRTAAEALQRASVLLGHDELPDPEEDEFYVEDLIGLDVVSPAGAVLGKVVDFESGGPQEWLVVEAGGIRSLVPFAEPLVQVDEPGKRVIVDAPEGLIEGAPVVRSE